jgi:cytochrome c oxidase accessory protein FixG
MLGLPFVSVGGESALRLDVAAGRLHAFGATFGIDEAALVSLAVAVLATAALLLVTLVLGRVWCGWACPQTVLVPRLRARILRRRVRGARPTLGMSGRTLRQLGDYALLALACAVVAADLLWYFVSPYEFFGRLAAGTLGPVLSGSWAALGALLFVDLAFVGATFCETACPYAKLQGVLFDRRTLVVAYDGSRAADCVDCGACVRVCPTGIDIREGLQMECIACAACVDACQPIMAKLRRAPDLVGYCWGEPGARPRPRRPAAVALALATLASAGLLAFTVGHRDRVAVVALPEAAFSPRRTPDGRVLNAYTVSLENRGRGPVEVGLSLRPEAGAAGEVALRPDRVELAAGERRQVRLLATARGLPPGRAPAALELEVRAGGAVVERTRAALPLVAPEGP